MLLFASKTYSDNNGTLLKLAQTTIASIEFMHTQIYKTVSDLKKKLPATQVELKWFCKAKATQDLTGWVKHLEELLKPLKVLLPCILGKELDAFSPTLYEKQRMLSTKNLNWLKIGLRVP
jgi:hypothetical protein